MLRIADNFGDYYAYQLTLNKNRRVKPVTLDKLDIDLGYNANSNEYGSNKKSSDFEQSLQKQLKKCR